MATVDIILIVVLVVGIVRGYMAGFINQLASLLGLVVGLVVARAMYGALADKLYSTVTDSMTAAQVMAFVLIWLAVPVAFAIVAFALTKLMSVVSLGWVNRWLGAGLGAIKYVLFASLVMCVLEFVEGGTDILNTDDSVLYDIVKQLGGLFVPAATDIVQNMVA